MCRCLDTLRVLLCGPLPAFICDHDLALSAYNISHTPHPDVGRLSWSPITRHRQSPRVVVAIMADEDGGMVLNLELPSDTRVGAATLRIAMSPDCK